MTTIPNNLESQLDRLIQSIKNEEINRLISTSISNALVLYQLIFYLKKIFNRNVAFDITNFSSIQEKVFEEIQKQSNPSSLQKLNTILESEIRKKSEFFGFEKHQTRTILKIYSKIIPPRSKYGERKVISRSQTLLENITIDPLSSNLSEEEIANLIVNVERNVVKFNKYFKETKNVLKRHLHGKIEEDLIKNLIQPKGVSLANLDITTIEQIYETKLRKHLRISLK